MNKSKMYLVCFVMVLISFPIYSYKTKPMEEKRMARQLALKEAANSNAAILATKEDAIPTIKQALLMVESILKGKYGMETVKPEKPFTVNLANNVWTIEGTVYEQGKTEAFQISLNKKTGDILSISDK